MENKQMDDPRGPFRTVIKVEPCVQRDDGTSTMITFSCGHVNPFNSTFHYIVGEEMRCFHCGPHSTPLMNLFVRVLDAPDALGSINGPVVASSDHGRRVGIRCTEAGDVYWTDATNVEAVR